MKIGARETGSIRDRQSEHRATELKCWMRLEHAELKEEGIHSIQTDRSVGRSTRKEEVGQADDKCEGDHAVRGMHREFNLPHGTRPPGLSIIQHPKRSAICDAISSRFPRILRGNALRQSENLAELERGRRGGETPLIIRKRAAREKVEWRERVT